MYALAELDGWATAIASIIGLIAVFAPFLNRVKALQTIQFGVPGVLNFIAEISTLTIFLSVVFYRNYLHLLPPFFLWIVLGLVGVIFLTWFDRQSRADSRDETAQRPAWQIATGAGAYALSIALVFMGMTQAAAQMVIFKPVNGRVVTASGEPRPLPVFLTVTAAGRIIETVTDGQGDYQFLLTDEEFRGIQKIQANLISDENPNATVADACGGEEGACYVPTIVFQGD